MSFEIGSSNCYSRNSFPDEITKFQKSGCVETAVGAALGLQSQTNANLFILFIQHIDRCLLMGACWLSETPFDWQVIAFASRPDHCSLPFPSVRSAPLDCTAANLPIPSVHCANQLSAPPLPRGSVVMTARGSVYARPLRSVEEKRKVNQQLFTVR